MKIKSAQLIYFSAAGTTEQTARLIGEGLALPTQGRNLLRRSYGETFWWYYYFGQKGTGQSEYSCH